MKKRTVLLVVLLHGRGYSEYLSAVFDTEVLDSVHEMGHRTIRIPGLLFVSICIHWPLDHAKAIDGSYELSTWTNFIHMPLQ